MAFHFREACANSLTNPAFDPVTLTEEYKTCAVRIEKLQTSSGRMMNTIEFRILLKESLNAAFRGESFDGPEVFDTWGKEFVALLENDHSKYRHVHSIIWNVADSLLDRMVHPCQCSELIENILVNPHAFLKTVLIIVNQLDEKSHIGADVPPRLH